MTDTGELERLRAENERLRKALGKISRTYKCNEYRLIHNEFAILQIARAALEGKG